MQFRRASRRLEVTFTLVWIPIAIAGFFVGYVSFHPQFLVAYYWDAMDELDAFREPLVLAFAKHYFSVFVTSLVLMGPPWAYWRLVQKIRQSDFEFITTEVCQSLFLAYVPGIIWLLITVSALVADFVYHFPDPGFILTPTGTPTATGWEWAFYVLKIGVSTFLFIGPVFLYCLTIQKQSKNARQ